MALWPLVVAPGQAKSDPWLAAVGLLFAIVTLTLALLAYCVAKRASTRDTARP